MSHIAPHAQTHDTVEAALAECRRRAARWGGTWCVVPHNKGGYAVVVEGVAHYSGLKPLLSVAVALTGAETLTDHRVVSDGPHAAVHGFNHMDKHMTWARPLRVEPVVDVTLKREVDHAYDELLAAVGACWVGDLTFTWPSFTYHDDFAAAKADEAFERMTALGGERRRREWQRRAPWDGDRRGTVSGYGRRRTDVFVRHDVRPLRAEIEEGGFTVMDE